MDEQMLRELRMLQSPGHPLGWLLTVARIVVRGLFVLALAFVAFGIVDFAIPELRAFIAEVHQLRAEN